MSKVGQVVGLNVKLVKKVFFWKNMVKGGTEC
jgi:hypothetical protein